MISSSEIFEKKIKPLFMYIGFIATGIFSVAYIVVIAIMITGLEASPTIETFVGFLIANLIAGACIAISLMIQGQDFAKNIEKNKTLLEQYHMKVLCSECTTKIFLIKNNRLQLLNRWGFTKAIL